MVKWEELSTKGFGRQGNTGCIVALIMSRMIVMIILSHHYQRTNGRAFRPKNGWEHRKCCFASFPMSARSGERPAPGALFNYQCITWVKWKELIMKGVRRQRNRGFRLALFMSKMMLMMILVMKGVRRQGNTGCILALIMSRMMLMMIWSHHYQHRKGVRRQRTGGFILAFIV